MKSNPTEKNEKGRGGGRDKGWRSGCVLFQTDEGYKMDYSSRWWEI